MLGRIGVVGLFMAAISVANAGERTAPTVTGYVQSSPDGRGCYWYRQRQFCGRYCYTEVDGRRFCRDRAREAYPQAPVSETITRWELPVTQPMKLGKGPIR